MKVLLIKPMEHPQVVDIENSLKEFYRILDCDCITATYPWEERAALVTDETGCSPRSHSADTSRSWSSPSRETSSSADWARRISQSCPRISSRNSGNDSGCRRHSSACSGRWQSSRWMTERSRNKIPQSEKIPSRPEKTGRAWFTRRSLWDTERCRLMARGNTAADTFWMNTNGREITARLTIRRWKRDLKKKARAHNRRVMHQAIRGEAN